MTTVLPLPLSYVGETGRQILFPTLLLDGAQAVLVDCGYPGYLDLLYIHRDCQHQGVASALCDFLETLYPVDRITVHASMTARPFFEARGYRVLRAQQVERRGQRLTNYVMEKEMV